MLAIAAPTVPYFGIIMIFNNIFKNAIRKDDSAICLRFPRRLSIAFDAVISEINIMLGLNTINNFPESLYEEPNTR